MTIQPTLYRRLSGQESGDTNRRAIGNSPRTGVGAGGLRVNAGNAGGLVGTLMGLATGIPLLSVVGNAVGTAIDADNARTNMYSPYGRPNVNFLPALTNSMTFGLLGQSANDQAARSYQDLSGTGLNQGALTAFLKQGYSGPKGINRPRESGSHQGTGGSDRGRPGGGPSGRSTTERGGLGGL